MENTNQQREEEYSFSDFISKLEENFSNNKGESFIGRTVNSEYLDRNNNIKPGYYEYTKLIVGNVLIKGASEKNENELEEHMEKAELNAFRYRFTETDENGNIKKYEYAFLKDKMVVNVFDANNNLLNKNNNEFEYKNYSETLIINIINNSKYNENSVLFKKNDYYLSIANTVLKSLFKNAYSDPCVFIIEYITQSGIGIIPDTLIKTVIEAGNLLLAGKFDLVNHREKESIEKRIKSETNNKNIERYNNIIKNIHTIKDIKGIENCAVMSDDSYDLIHSLESKRIKVATEETLKIACSKENLNLFNYLITYGEPNEIEDKNFVADLFNYIYHPKVAKEIFELLLDDNFNNLEEQKKIDIINKAFENIIKNGNLEVIQSVFIQTLDYVKNNKIETRYLNEIFSCVVKNGNLEVIQSVFLQTLDCIKNNIIETRYLNEIFSFVVKNGTLELIQYVFNKISKEIFQNDKEKIKEFINEKDEFNRTLLDVTILANNKEAFEFLLKQNIFDINTKDRRGGNISLHHAINVDNIEIVKLLLQQPNIDINAKGDFRRTPFFIAIEKGNVEIVKLLLQQPNIDINAKDFFDRTVLRHAIEKGNIEIVNLLLQQKYIDVNAKERNRKTPLYYAIEKGNIEIINLLLQRPDIDVNAKDENEKNPLQYAIKKGNIEIIKLLLQHQDINISSAEEEQKIIDLAIENKNLDMITFCFNAKVRDISIRSNNIEEKKQKIKDANTMLGNIKKKYNLRNNPFRRNIISDGEFKKSLNETISLFEKFLNKEKKEKDI